MKLLPLKIGDLVAKVSIIQGGMGIGVSNNRCRGIGDVRGVAAAFMLGADGIQVGMGKELWRIF